MLQRWKYPPLLQDHLVSLQYWCGIIHHSFFQQQPSFLGTCPVHFNKSQPLLFVQFSSNIGVHVCQPYLLWPGDCSQAALHRTFDLSGKRSLTEIQSCPPSLTSEWLLTCQRLSLLISHLSLLGFKFVASVFVAPSCVLWWLEGSCGLHRTREDPDLIPNHWLS